MMTRTSRRGRVSDSRILKHLVHTSAILITLACKVPDMRTDRPSTLRYALRTATLVGILGVTLLFARPWEHLGGYTIRGIVVIVAILTFDFVTTIVRPARITHRRKQQKPPEQEDPGNTGNNAGQHHDEELDG